MPYIKVDVDKISKYQKDVWNIRSTVRTISSDFSNINYLLDSDVKNVSGIQRKLQNIESSFSDHKAVLYNANTFLGNAALKYKYVEDTLYARDKASGDAVYTDIDEISEIVAKKHGLSVDSVKEVMISGKYSLEEIVGYTDGTLSDGAVAVLVDSVSSMIAASAEDIVSAAGAVDKTTIVNTSVGGGGGALGEGGGGSRGATIEDEAAETISKKKGIPVDAVKEILLSGNYPIAEILAYAEGGVTSGALATEIEKIPTKLAVPESEYSEDEKKRIVALAAAELGIDEEKMCKGIEDGEVTLGDILEVIDGNVKTANKLAKYLKTGVGVIDKIAGVITGSGDLLFTEKDGYVILSNFTRDGKLNDLVEKYHDGTGIGTRYTVGGLVDTPVLGDLYKIEKVADATEKLAKGAAVLSTTITGISTAVNKIEDTMNNEDLSDTEKVITSAGIAVTTTTDTALSISGILIGGETKDIINSGKAVMTNIVSTTDKVQNILKDDTLSDKEKGYDTAAVILTSAVGTALAVGAPFAGAAVETAVTAAFTAAFPGAGTVVGKAVGVVAGAAVEKGMELVSEVVMSEAVVEQVSDSLEKVGDAVSAGVAAVSDAGKKLLESKNVGDAVTNTVELVGQAAIAGVTVIATGAVEYAKTYATIATETVKTAVEKIEKKAEEVSEAAKKAAEAAKKVAEEAKKAAEAAAKKAAEEIAKKAAAAKKAAEEAAKKAAAEAKKKAEEIAKKAAAAKKAAEEAAKKAAEAAKKAAEAAAKKAAEAAKKAAAAVKNALKKW